MGGGGTKVDDILTEIIAEASITTTNATKSSGRVAQKFESLCVCR